LFFAGPHSIYFQTLGEQGFVGLGLFLGLLGSCGLSLWRMARLSRHVPSLNWAGPYAYMLGTSLLAYMVSGAFLPRAYFDFFYTLVATVIIMNLICQKELRDLAAQTTFAEPEMNLAEVTVP
jgi:O-antigen ligase